jgi:ABC-type polysaccharide/polyol phosphate export permease
MHPKYTNQSRVFKYFMYAFFAIVAFGFALESPESLSVLAPFAVILPLLYTIWFITATIAINYREYRNGINRKRIKRHNRLIAECQRINSQ